MTPLPNGLSFIPERTMITKDIEEIKSEAINIWAEHDIYQALDHVITTLTQHHKTEVERARDTERKRCDIRVKKEAEALTKKKIAHGQAMYEKGKRESN